jgi:Fe-S-cluster containining protein
MQCGKGCTACCHGLFDISLADAFDVVRGFNRLSKEIQRSVGAKALDLHRVIAEAADNLHTPLFFQEDDPQIDRIVEAAKSPPCPFLGAAGECLIYEQRPLQCRLEGVPLIDVTEGAFGDWCELNFKEGIPEKAAAEIALNYNEIDSVQEARSSEIARHAGLPDSDALTFIPSVIAEFESFWKHLL